MATFDVDVEGVTYEVDAPDERTAWKWANVTHTKERATDPNRSRVSEIPANAPAGYDPAQAMRARLAGVNTELTLPEKILSKLPFGITNQRGVDLAAGASSLMRGGLNQIIPGAGEKIWPTSGATNSGWRTAGEFADPVGLAIGGGAAKALPYAKVLGNGFVEGAKALGKNLAGGAAAGGAIGALSEGGTTMEGAGMGAAANVALPPALSAGGKLAGKVWDVMAGRYGVVNAGKIVRQAAGGDLTAAKILTQVAGPELTAAQATAGLKNDMLDALGELAKQTDETNYFSRKATAQGQERINAISKIAGGANQTEARQVAGESNKALNALVKPMYEQELGAANVAGNAGRRLQGEAERFGAAAAAKADDVRRLSGAQAQAEALAQRGQMTLGPRVDQGQARLPGRYSYGTDLAQRAEGAAQGAADASLALGDAGRLAKYELDSIAAHGLKPVDTGKILNQLMGRLNSPSAAGSKKYETVLSRVASDIQEWTARNGGQIDAEALYSIKKNSVNEAVESLTQGLDPKSSAKFSAKVLAEVGPMIDEAITVASGGGPGWKNLLKTVAQGKHQIEQQKMGAVALGLLKKSPNKFVSLVNKEEPKMVEKVFGPKEFDIEAMMGEKYLPMRKAADEITRDLGIEEGAGRGGLALRNIINENTPRFKLFNVLDPRVALMNRILGEGEVLIGKATQRHLTEGMKSGKSLNELLNTLPTTERNKVLSAMERMKIPGMGAAQGGGLAGILAGQSSEPTSLSDTLR